LCGTRARGGRARASAEGPLDYAGRIAGRVPASETAVRAIVSLYVDLRYGPRAELDSIARLKRLVREFRP
jgi:hypothetical protein